MNFARDVVGAAPPERLAMIERGLVPSPERDPAAFEQRLMPVRVSQKRSRFRTAG